ncbi:MAG: aldo/keto reductase [Thermomicrobia bacterium]|nr:aldo/keto reductase [Thermomicrobia bacterium]
MEHRPLGRTGLQVSALGYGSGAIGGLFTKGDPAEQQRAIARALDAGITYYDTASSYGNGRSEENLGRVLRDLRAWDRVIVGTKVRLTTDDLSDPVAAIQHSTEASLRRLDHDRVDLLQLHNPITQPGTGALQTASGGSVGLDTVQGAIAEGLQRVVERGLARQIGFTGLGETAALHDTVTSGVFATMQSYFNAVNPSAGYAGASGGEQDFGGLIDTAADAGVGVIAIRVLAAGALALQPERHANAGDPGAPLVGGGAYTHDMNRAKDLSWFATEAGLENTLEMAVRFALAKPGIATVLVGYSDLAQLEDALRWAARGPLPPDVTAQIVAAAR